MSDNLQDPVIEDAYYAEAPTEEVPSEAPGDQTEEEVRAIKEAVEDPDEETGDISEEVN